VSEGRDTEVISSIAAAAESLLLDLHSDRDHHRSVLTIGGPAEGVLEAARRVTTVALDKIDIQDHCGTHPRLGAVDVVPFVPLDSRGSPVTGSGADKADNDAGSSGNPGLALALSARDQFAFWAGSELDLPCFLYGPERALPEIRRLAFKGLDPDFGPAAPHPSAGSCAVGAREALVAYNIWLRDADLGLARSIASELRGPQLRALGLAAGADAQVSFNLLRPDALGPQYVYDEVCRRLLDSGNAVSRAELVGLIPLAVLEATPPSRWDELDIGPERTIEMRLARALS